MILKLVLISLSIIHAFALAPNKIKFSSLEAEDDDLYLDSVENEEESFRIFQGATFDVKQHSYTLALLTRNNNNLIGGAVLVKKNWALTAGWNVLNYNASELKTRSYTKNCYEKGHQAKVDQIILHQNYSGWQNNVALLKLTGNLKKEATIPIRDSLPAEGEKVTIIGWGSYDGSIYTDGNLRKGEAEFISYDNCSSYYDQEDGFYDSSFCTRNSAKFGPCYMDYGNPVVYGKSLIGLFSGSFSCNNANYPAVNVDLTKYKAWVDEVTKSD